MTIEKTKDDNILKRLLHSQMIIPLAALLALVVFNLIADPSFFAITINQDSTGNSVLAGQLISILNNGSELAILAIGMTLVTAATGGQDISVGATIAVAGSAMLAVLCGGNMRPDTLAAPIIVAFLFGVVIAMVCGAFNGVMVAVFKVQPMVATLILYTAGRSIAAWINNNALPIIPTDSGFGIFGGFIPGVPIPTPVFIAIACFVVIFLVLKFTSLGPLRPVRGHQREGRAPQRPEPHVHQVAHVRDPRCVRGRGRPHQGQRISTINYQTIAADIEMDAILAVALGGNALSGGKFNMGSSILGAYVIQFLTTTLYKFNVASAALPAYKAVVVIILVVLSAPIVRAKLSAIWKKIRSPKQAEVEAVK